MCTRKVNKSEINRDFLFTLSDEGNIGIDFKEICQCEELD